MQIKSYAKANLILKIYPRNKQEIKHKIKSLFILDKSLFDLISIKPSKKDTVIYKNKNKTFVLNDCLIVKSLKYLKNEFNIAKHYSIKVEKNINIMSGLGGGSSNAATVIKYVMKDNKISLTKLNLKDVALKLGSDIPFFLFSYNSAIVSDYGNKVEKFNSSKKISYKIHTNNIKISTKEVFKQLEKTKPYKSQVNFSKCLDSLLNKTFNNHYVYNDLHPYILKVSDKKLLQNINKISSKNKIICGSGGTILTIHE